MVIGINNSLHAADVPYVKPEGNTYVNAQDFGKLFELLDATILKMLPNANVKFAPLISVIDETWLKTEMCQNAFREINQLIANRQHVELDSNLPKQMNWIGRGRDKEQFCQR